MSHPMLMPIRLTLAAICATALLHAAPALAQQAAVVQLSYSNGAFQPSEVTPLRCSVHSSSSFAKCLKPA